MVKHFLEEKCINSYFIIETNRSDNCVLQIMGWNVIKKFVALN